MKNSILFLLLSSSLTAGTIIQFGGDEGIIADSNHISQIGGGTQIDQIIDWLGNSSAGTAASGTVGGSSSRAPGATLASETYGLTLTSVAVAGNGATGTRSSGNPNVLGVDPADAAKFDSSSGDTWTFEFDEDVKLRQLILSALDNAGETISVSGGATASFNRGDVNSAPVTFGTSTTNRYVYTFPTPVDVSAGTDITIQSTQGSWGLQGVVVEFDYQPPAPVDPDPFEPNPDGGVEPAALTPLKPAPNVIIFIADDMGIGDSSAYQDLTGNADAVQIDTPEMERLANMGTRFTDAHTNGATCSPSRISLLTGTYSFRSPLKIAAVQDTSHIHGVILPGRRTTIAHMMQRVGFRTYGYGKWHMALRGDAGDDTNSDGVIDVVGSGELAEGPIECGFDTWTGTPGNFSYAGAMIQDKQYMRFGSADPSDYSLVPINDPSAQPWVGQGPSFPTDPNLYKVQPAVFGKLQSDLETHMSSRADEPFFVYYASHSNHDPYVPANYDADHPDGPRASLNDVVIDTAVTKAGGMIEVETAGDLNGDGIPDPDYSIYDPNLPTFNEEAGWRWNDNLREKHWDHVSDVDDQGNLTINGPTSRAMMVQENDVIVGYMLDFLEQTDDPRNPGYKLIDNTIFIFTSDNGSDIKSEAAVGALPQSSDGVITDLTGFKGNRYEGGTRVPFIAAWPNPADANQASGIPAGATSSAIFGLNDMYATLAEAIGHQMHDKEAVDSESLLNAWVTGQQGTVRATDLLYKYQQRIFSRRGEYKLAAKDSDYVAGAQDRFADSNNLDFDDMVIDSGSPAWTRAFVDLSNDLSELNDLGATATANAMLSDLQTLTTQGFSRAGASSFENGVNFKGGNLFADANWHAYNVARSGIVAGSATPGIISVDGSAVGTIENRTYVHRAATITYSPYTSGELKGSLYELDGGTLSVDDDLRMSNSRFELFSGITSLGSNNLELNGTNCVVIVSGGDINAANLSVGEAGASAGFKIVRFKGGAGSVTLTGGVSFGDDGDSTNDFIDFVSGSRGRLVSPAGTINYASLWNMGQLRIDGVAGGTGGFTTSAFKVITLGDGNEALVLADGDQIVTFDYDDDRISDVWEQDTVGGMDLLSMTSDYDGDGILDIEEYILDFDPTSPDSPFAASIIWNSGNSVDIRFGSKASRNYLVQFTSDLTASEWMTLNYEVGTDGVFNFNDDPQGSTRGFYKVQVFLP
jgi:arylsulfatase A-like enzyme